MAKKIIKLEETDKKANNKTKINLGKIKEVIDKNPKAVKKITEGIGELIINNSQKATKSKAKTTSKKNTKSASKSDMSKTIKTITNLLGK